ncbi:MAG: aminotransferase class I/II-fold pyridoxal phosphate-dependent enzyme [Mucilaginibacter sp.]|nr:aminotransferase class I/II-fold pyridoxal phosphate-dependent enzyme [Mucilaginibacter sp.]
MKSIEKLAIVGGTPLFDHCIADGQQFFPSWEQYESLFRDIFERQYYTNHGPLAQLLEQKLAEQLNVKHAICVTNGFIGLALAGQALGVTGRVVVPANTHVATIQSLDWTHAKPLICDVDESGMLTAEILEPILASHNDISAVLAVNLWGDCCELTALEQLTARYGIALYFDSAHGFGCEFNGKPLGGFGSLEVMSLNASNIVTSAEGGVICTQSDDLAAHIRNIRSNYGMGYPVVVEKTSNGRMSEAQAGIALHSLDALDNHRERNEKLFNLLGVCLKEIPGLHLRYPQKVSKSNFQNIVLEVDSREFGLSCEYLSKILRSENLITQRGFSPYACFSQIYKGCVVDLLPVTQKMAESILIVPFSALFTEDLLVATAEKLKIIHQFASVLTDI